MPNKIYDTLKFIALLIAPIVVFITTVCNVWGVPHTTEIAATLSAADVLFGAIVAVAKQIYDKKQKNEEREEQK